MTEPLTSAAQFEATRERERKRDSAHVSTSDVSGCAVDLAVIRRAANAIKVPDGKKTIGLLLLAPSTASNRLDSTRVASIQVFWRVSPTVADFGVDDFGDCGRNGWQQLDERRLGKQSNQVPAPCCL